MTINEITKIATERADRHEIEEANLFGGLSQTYYYSRIKNAEISSFIAGAEWAKENQFCSWISVEDGLPCDHDELWEMTGGLIYTKKVLVILADNTVKLMSMLYDEVNNKWKWDSILKNKIMFWMPIPKLPETPKSVE